MVHDPISSTRQRDHLGITFSHIQSILIGYKWILNSINFKHALDIGCGEGYGAEILKEAGAMVVAVDIHLPALKNINNYEIFRLCADTFKMGIRDRSFDLIVGSHIIEHFDDCEREHFLSEIKRVLIPGGAVVIATPNPAKGFHYQHSGVHKILYDRDHLYDVLTRYFDFVEFYGVYPRVMYRVIKDFLKRGKQFLNRTGLLDVSQIQSSIKKTSVGTTALNFRVRKYSPGTQHLIAVCR
jgi:SAM-dependent methyltransferase